VNALFLTAALLIGASPLPDGSLIFIDNSNQFVELYTGSSTTHVAVVVRDQGEAWVYEATPAEVRKVTLDAYYAELGRINQRRDDDDKVRAWLVRPRHPYNDQQVAALRKSLESQVGRRYSVKGYVRGESDGIHCAELAASALCAAGVCQIERCQDESPAELLARVEESSIPKALLTLPEPEEQEDWCARSQRDWAGFTNWCRWSCWETWTFCW
jgi:hypothetical protein